MRAIPPWSPDPDDDPVVREPQAQFPSRVVVAFLKVGDDKRSALAALDEVKAIGGIHFSVRLVVLPPEGQRGTFYALLAQTKLPLRQQAVMEFEKDLTNARHVKYARSFPSLTDAQKAIWERFRQTGNVATQHRWLYNID